MLQYGAALAIQSFFIFLAYWKQNWNFALIGLAFGVTALLFPPFTVGLERAWKWIGITLARIVNPITLMILFIFILVPFGLLARAMRWLNPAFNTGKDTELVAVNACPSKKSFLKPF